MWIAFRRIDTEVKNVIELKWKFNCDGTKLQLNYNQIPISMELPTKQVYTSHIKPWKVDVRPMSGTILRYWYKQYWQHDITNDGHNIPIMYTDHTSKLDTQLSIHKSDKHLLTCCCFTQHWQLHHEADASNDGDIMPIIYIGCNYWLTVCFCQHQQPHWCQYHGVSNDGYIMHTNHIDHALKSESQLLTGSLFCFNLCCYLHCDA